MRPTERTFKNRGAPPRREVRRFRLEARDGRWRTLDASGNAFTARGQYVFVRVGDVLWVARCRPYETPGRVNHHELARGADVAFAGTARFGHGPRRGVLKTWDDASGHYQPDAAFAWQAALPLELSRRYGVR